VPAHAPDRHHPRRVNVRALLVRFLVNATLIGTLILVLPGFELHTDRPVLAVLWLAVLFGVIGALVVPVLEFLALPYVLQTFGLVVIVIDVVLLGLLDLLSRTFDITTIVALLVGALLAGVLGFVIENVLGLTQPVLDDQAEASA
jgi:putative membrane protein